MLGLLETLDLGMQRASPLCDDFPEFRGLRLEIGVAEIFETLLLLQNRIHDRLDALQRTIESGPENLCEQTVCHYAPNGTGAGPRYTRAPAQALNIEWNGLA